LERAFITANLNEDCTTNFPSPDSCAEDAVFALNLEETVFAPFLKKLYPFPFSLWLVSNKIV